MGSLKLKSILLMLFLVCHSSSSFDLFNYYQMTLSKARILSSDASVKQEQNTNINIKIQPKQSQPTVQSIPQHQRTPSNQSSSINFTQAEQNLTSTLQPQTSNLIQDRGIADLGIELDELETKNHFLENQFISRL